MSLDPHKHILEIEQTIEDLTVYVEHCRKAMQLSRAAILAGALLGVGALVGLFPGYRAVAGIAGFAAMIGGFVWLGASKSSREEARGALARTRAELAEAIDALGLQELN